MNNSEAKIQGQLDLSTLKGSYHLTPGSKQDLVLMVHGKAGNRQVMTIFERSFMAEANFVYAEADLVDPIGGYSWWLDSSDTNYEIASEKIKVFLEEVILKFALQPRRIIACGFSQGGACLSWLSQSREGIFSHLVMICSFYLKQDKILGSYPSTFIYHGLSDQVVNVAQASKAVEFLTSQATSVTFVSDLQGHKISTKGVKSLRDWLLRELS